MDTENFLVQKLMKRTLKDPNGRLKAIEHYTQRVSQWTLKKPMNTYDVLIDTGKPMNTKSVWNLIMFQWTLKTFGSKN